MMAHDAHVTQNVGAHRFEIDNAQGVAVLTYHEGGDHITLVHTEVAPELEGNGYGSLLARAALEYARKAQLRVIPACPFVQAYIKRHPEFADLTKLRDS
jgi:uncharacterized protein